MRDHDRDATYNLRVGIAAHLHPLEGKGHHARRLGHGDSGDIEGEEDACQKRGEGE